MFWNRALRRAAVLLFVVAAGIGTSVVARAQQPPPRAAQDEFVPIDQLPPDDRLPAARLLIIAYSVAWLLVAGYLYSIWQRLGRVERDLAEARRRLPPPGLPNDPRPR